MGPTWVVSHIFGQKAPEDMGHPVVLAPRYGRTQKRSPRPFDPSITEIATAKPMRKTSFPSRLSVCARRASVFARLGGGVNVRGGWRGGRGRLVRFRPWVRGASAPGSGRGP